MLEITKDESGNLVLSVPHPEDQADLKEQLESDRSNASVWADLFEPYFTNGSYEPISPEVYQLGLTSDPYIIAEELNLEDDGTVTHFGGLWHCPDYMVIDPIAELAEGETVILREFYNTKGTYEKLETHN